MTDLKNIPIKRFLLYTEACSDYGLSKYGRSWKKIYDLLPERQTTVLGAYDTVGKRRGAPSLNVVKCFLLDRNIAIYDNLDKRPWKEIKTELEELYEIAKKYYKEKQALKREAKSLLDREINFPDWANNFDKKDLIQEVIWGY